jgi:hypothetical protein
MSTMGDLLDRLARGDLAKSNPEGINQYTRGGGGSSHDEYKGENDRMAAAKEASANADAASAKANDFKDATGTQHAKLADLHEAAAQEHTKAFNAHLEGIKGASLANNVRGHFEAGAYHTNKYQEHMAKAKMGRGVDRVSAALGRSLLGGKNDEVRDLIKSATRIDLPGPTFSPFTKAAEPPPMAFMAKRDDPARNE